METAKKFLVVLMFVVALALTIFLTFVKWDHYFSTF